MAAYVAIACFRFKIEWAINFVGFLLPAPFLENLEVANRGLKSFQEFIERLDSSTRKTTSASLGFIAEKIQIYNGNYSRLIEVVGSSDQPRYEISILLEHLQQDMEEWKIQLAEDGAASSSGGKYKSKMIGLSDEYSKLKAELVGDWFGVVFFSILGMAGIGKTTFAREIFEDLDVFEWFDCRIWVTLGKEFKSEEIAQTILAQVDPDAYKMLTGAGYEEIVAHLRKHIKGTRYLIVLDDIWDLSINSYLKSLFPDDENGSRVLLTTRRWLIARADSFFSHVMYMRLLNKKESWHLLCANVFGEDHLCPPQLEKVGKEIAKKCDGLPLTIITLANLLLKAGATEESLWIDVATQKKHQLFIETYDKISKVLYPSYEVLSDELKLHFLYMGVFPQKYEIPRSKLFNLWIVEEFITYEIDLKLKDHCEICLHYFYSESVMMIHKRSTRSFPNSTLKIKSCGLHSSWWHFCQREARKNNFFQVLDCYDDGFGEGIKNQSRLSIHTNVLFGIKDVHDSIEENCASTAHSLLCLGPYHQYPVPVCFGLKLLQKLDALNIRFYEFPLEVLELIKLRYLALTFNGKLPPSISKLSKIQFLIVNPHLSIKPNGSMSSYLPREIWDMKKLVYLQVMGWDLPDLGDTCLQELSTISGVSTASCSILKRVPNLKKLGIQIELTPDHIANPLCFSDHISHLINLESLKCVIVNPECTFDIFSPIASFPSLPFSLNKLSLSGMGYHWKEMSKIASLPHLEVLKLRCNAFQGPKWKIEENGFQKLRFLSMEDMDIVQLKGGPGSFKYLMYIRMQHCYKLKELHLDSCEYFSKFEVVDCNPSVTNDLKRIITRVKTLEHLRVHSSWNP